MLLSEVTTAVTAEADLVATPDAAPLVAAEDPAPKRGFLGFLKRQADDAKGEQVVEAAPVAVPAEADTTAEKTVLASAAVAEAAPKPRFSLFKRRAAVAEAPVADAPKVEADPKAEPVQVAAAAAPKKGWGLFGKSSEAKTPKAGAPDYREVGPGVVLPYGEMARLCGVPANKLGAKVAKYPERGSGYTLYDSAPNGTSLRNYYVTGFDDGCARQFTAALALFGPPQMHELLRYGLPAKVQPYSATDAAYETLKRQICKVAKGKPCGEKLDQVGRNTVFVSAYDKFEGSQRWHNILLHDGEVVAIDVKSK
ncbi:hypothetical protein PRI8871_01824 [Pseudoprimorskyibacter insulae]|uniref:Uncharacterized protein n=1 Tax=Pseudoprimorskyibacter insulae TaxID=1695997 RepID=A0A2R8AVG9_9RHOB|nr:hypothetical protein PRI8871_01824 [Pseudoprimorskyibacter insulae]